MYKYFFLLILLVIIIYFKINNEKYQNEQKNPSLDFIKKIIKEISIYRPVESTNLQNVKNIIFNIMKNMNLKTNIQSFTRVINNKTYSFDNLIGYNMNSNPNSKYLLLGAHIDSPQIIGTESAIDAATSIAIILRLTQQILKKYPKYPIMIVFFDGEEAIDGKWNKNNTLSGSKYFVNNFNLDTIDKVYIMDLIGGSIKDNQIYTFESDINSYDDMNLLEKINEKYNDKISIHSQKSRQGIINDYTSFLQKNKFGINLIPAQFPITHHTLDDNYDNINWKYIEIYYNIFYEFLVNKVKN